MVACPDHDDLMMTEQVYLIDEAVLMAIYSMQTAVKQEPMNCMWQQEETME